MTIKETNVYAKWFASLRDDDTKARIDRRIKNAARGIYGDVKPVGELRFHFGPGYRAYFKEIGGVLSLLLAGGDKSTQRRDIDRAKEIARHF